MFIPISVKQKYKNIKENITENPNKKIKLNEIKLVDYSSDEDKIDDKDDIIQYSKNQRYPKKGEPICIVFN